jgi:hypothetical protein
MLILESDISARRLPCTPCTTTQADRTERWSYVRRRPKALVANPVHGPIRRRQVLGELINQCEPAA